MAEAVTATKQETPKKDPGQQLQTVSERFVSQVQAQFVAEMGSALAFTDYERTLAQHMYIKVDAQLKSLEIKRINAGGKPEDAKAITWQHVNLSELALDTVHRIGLGLDALIPNHIAPIPYWNTRLGKYGLDLRIGYVGKDYCRREMAVEKPVEVIYQLVHETDEFEPLMKDDGHEIESYVFKIKNPFSRGKVIGGFGYIRYTDPKQNMLVIVDQRKFAKAKASAKTMDFWGENKSEEEMQYKTVVHRTTEKIPLDPRKVNAQHYAYIEAQESEADIDREIETNANGKIIDVVGQIVDEDTGEINSGASAGQPPPAAQEREPGDDEDPGEYPPTGTEGPGY